MLVAATVWNTILLVAVVAALDVWIEDGLRRKTKHAIAKKK